MITEPQTAAEIAATLTKAQIHKLLAIGDGQPAEFLLEHCGFILVEMGLASVNDLGARHLTDVGHAVRAILEGSKP